MFDEARVNTWLRRHDREQRDAVREFIRRTDAQTLRARDTLTRLVAQYVRPEDVARQWSALGAHVRSETTRMLAALAEHPSAPVPTTSPEAPPAADRRVLAPDELRAILASNPATHPWPAPAIPAIQRCVARGLSVEITPRGWHPIDEVWRIGMQSSASSSSRPPAATTAVRELLTRLARTPATIAPPSVSVAAVPVIRTPSRTLRAAHAQRAALEAALIDLRRAIASGAVIPRANATQDGITRVIACKTKILALPRVATRSGTDPDAIAAALRRAADEALAELEPRRNERSKTA
jgi:hypothetical protein